MIIKNRQSACRKMRTHHNKGPYRRGNMQQEEQNQKAYIQFLNNIVSTMLLKKHKRAASDKAETFVDMCAFSLCV